MDVLQCVRCGTAYTTERDTAWGRTKGSNGYGPRPCCTALVPNEYAPRTASGEIPQQVCGGQLIAKTETEATATATARGVALKVIAEEPITTAR